MQNLTGKSLGRYRILQRVGRGGMAEVYQAYQPSLDRHVAVKVLHPFLLEEDGARERFQREARAVAALRHPNIVQVFDYDNEGDVYFMVMEFIDGPNLKAVLQEHATQGARLAPEQVVEIINGIGGALAYAHRQGMIHRDVKPQNIMFTREGQPLLTDFGIAKIVGGGAGSASGSLSGTPAYMSPEQGRSLPLDNRTDIYSLGVVLYEMVTGRVPFDADTPFAILIKHINEPLPRPRTLDPAISPALERVILTALAKTPDERFATADEMARAVQEAAAETATTRPLPGLSAAEPTGRDVSAITAAPLPVEPGTSETPPAESAPSLPQVPPAPPAPATMSAQLTTNRFSCTLAVSVLAALLLLIGGAGYLGLSSGVGTPPVSSSSGGAAAPAATAVMADASSLSTMPPTLATAAAATALAVQAAPAGSEAGGPGSPSPTATTTLTATPPPSPTPVSLHDRVPWAVAPPGFSQ